MMGKLNLDKVNGAGPLRTDGHREVRNNAIQPGAAVERTAPVSETDKVEISTQAAEVGKLVGKLKALPDIREEKVNSARERLASGTFKPAPQEIADAILKEEAN